MTTSEQRRAADALNKVLSLEYESEDLKKRYRAYVDRLGPMIIANGLGQALATERASAGESPSKDDERSHMKLYKNINDWLCRTPDGIYPGAADLIQALMSDSEDLYLRAQAESLAWLGWHKRFCRAYLPRDSRPDEAQS